MNTHCLYLLVYSLYVIVYLTLVLQTFNQCFRYQFVHRITLRTRLLIPRKLVFTVHHLNTVSIGEMSCRRRVVQSIVGVAVMVMAVMVAVVVTSTIQWRWKLRLGVGRLGVIEFALKLLDSALYFISEVEVLLLYFFIFIHFDNKYIKKHATVNRIPAE